MTDAIQAPLAHDGEEARRLFLDASRCEHGTCPDAAQCGDMCALQRKLEDSANVRLFRLRREARALNRMEARKGPTGPLPLYWSGRFLKEGTLVALSLKQEEGEYEGIHSVRSFFAFVDGQWTNGYLLVRSIGLMLAG